jgi:O-antigen ligase
LATFFNKLAFVLICAICVMTTLAYGTVHQPVIAFFYLLVCAGFLSFAASSFFGEAFSVSRHLLQLPLVLLLSYAVLQTVPFGTYADGSIDGIARTISIEPNATKLIAYHLTALAAFFFVALSLIDSAARLRKMTTFITAFGFFYAFYAILQSVLSPDKIFGIYKPSAGLPFGSFVNKHDFAAIIEMAVAIPLGLLFCGSLRSDKRLLYGVAVALMAVALLLSGSRGGLVAFVAEVLFIVFITSRTKGFKNIVLKTGLAGALLVAAIGGAIFVGGDTTLTRIAETATSDDVSSNRFQIWSVTLNVIREHLPFGAGLGAFPQAYTKFDTSGGYERVEQAHNDYLQMAADAGLPGIVIGGLFLFLLFRTGYRSVAVANKFRRGAAVGAFAGCFAILVHSLFDFVLHITAVSVMFLTLLAILAASGREYDDDTDEYESRRSSRKPGSISHIRRSA